MNFFMKISSMQWLLAGCMSAAALFTLISWQQSPTTKPPNRYKLVDTVPGKRDLDNELREIANARQQVAIAAQQDFSAMQDQLRESLASLDENKIRLQAEKALHEVNIGESAKAAELVVSKIEFDNLLRELEQDKRISKKERDKARKEIEKARKQLQTELKNKDWEKQLEAVDWKEVEKDMQQAKIDLEAAKTELGEQSKHMREELGKATKELDAAEKELRGYQEMLYQLQSEGKLDTSKDYRVEWSNKVLTINGNAQPESESSHYEKYFNDNYTLIKKKNGQMSIEKKNSKN